MKPNHIPYKPILHHSLSSNPPTTCLSWDHGRALSYSPMPPQNIFKFSSIFSSVLPGTEKGFLLSKANLVSLSLPTSSSSSIHNSCQLTRFFPFSLSSGPSPSACKQGKNLSSHPQRAFPWYTTPWSSCPFSFLLFTADFLKETYSLIPTSWPPTHI